MPIPPPDRYAPSTLNKKQEAEQLAVCYGVNMQNENQQISATDVEKMRHIVAQHDSTAKKTTIHDLNNPPKEPYRFQKFPMMVYDLGNSHPAKDVTRPKPNGQGTEVVHIPAKVVTQVVRSEEHLQAALEGGWSEEAPNFTPDREEVLSPKYQGEAKRVQALIDVSQPDAVSPLDKMSKPELVALAKETGTEIDSRWGIERIRAALKSPESQVA